MAAYKSVLAFRAGFEANAPARKAMNKMSMRAIIDLSISFA